MADFDHPPNFIGFFESLYSTYKFFRVKCERLNFRVRGSFTWRNFFFLQNDLEKWVFNIFYETWTGIFSDQFEHVLNMSNNNKKMYEVYASGKFFSSVFLRIFAFLDIFWKWKNFSGSYTSCTKLFLFVVFGTRSNCSQKLRVQVS